MGTYKDIASSIRKSAENKTSAYDTTATVQRIEGDTVWVHIPGGVNETPVMYTVDCKEGDTVMVRVGNGKAWLTGNATAPPTDNTVANEAKKSAKVAHDIAVRAQSAASDTNDFFYKDRDGTHMTTEEYGSKTGINILEDALGVYIRNNAEDLAAFLADKIQLNRDVTATGAVNAGNVTATGAVNAGNVTATGAVNAGNVTATGAVNAGNVTATGAVNAGSVTATGAVNAGSVTATGAVNAGSVTATGAVKAGSVTATGAVNAGSVTATGYINGTNLEMKSNSTSLYGAGNSGLSKSKLVLNDISARMYAPGGFPSLYLDKDSISINSKNILRLTVEIASIEFAETLNSENVTAFFYPSANDYGLIALGSPNHRWYRSYSTMAESVDSDERLKKDIRSLELEDFFSRLKPIQYRFKNNDKKIHFGFVAQDIVKAMTECGMNEFDYDFINNGSEINDGEEENYYSLAYSEFIALNTSMIQKQQKEIDVLKTEIAELKDIISREVGK